jgi:hypothetical protein
MILLFFWSQICRSYPLCGFCAVLCITDQNIPAGWPSQYVACTNGRLTSQCISAYLMSLA